MHLSDDDGVLDARLRRLRSHGSDGYRQNLAIDSFNSDAGQFVDRFLVHRLTQACKSLCMAIQRKRWVF
jgi:hypothetical protein